MNLVIRARNGSERPAKKPKRSAYETLKARKLLQK
jgi:hypothetical protein